MANPTTAAGDNGVSGTCTETELLAQIDAITGSISGGNLSSTETTAVRGSVARTRRGYDTATGPSDVYSVTQGLRFAYHQVECDAAPGAITRT
jgi:hypothetical protein